MAGVIPAECQYTGKLVRFGYVEVQLPQGLTEKGTAERPEPEKIKAHEFHYFDSTANGEDCIATKPVTPEEAGSAFMHRTIISGAFHICIIRQIQSLWNGFWKEQKNTFEIAKKTWVC